MNGHQMQHPGRLLTLGARPAGAEDGPLFREDLGLDEEIAEGRMQGVGDGRCQDHLGITGDIDLSFPPGAVGKGYPPQLDIILGRHDNLGIGVEIVVPAAKLGPSFGKNRLKIFPAASASADRLSTRTCRWSRRGYNRRCPSCRRCCLRASG